jgi:DNA-binding NarL/FixJ family response regulator
MDHSHGPGLCQSGICEPGTFLYVRILLAGMSNMLSSIVTAALAQAPDLSVVGHVREDEDLAAQISLTHADAVIARSSRPGAIENFVPLLNRFPALKLVAVDNASNSGFVHQLRPYSIRLPELSADLLQSVLRTQLAPARGVRR